MGLAVQDTFGHLDGIRLFILVENKKPLVAEVNSLEASMCFAEMKMDERETEEYSKLVT